MRWTCVSVVETCGRFSPLFTGCRVEKQEHGTKGNVNGEAGRFPIFLCVYFTDKLRYAPFSTNAVNNGMPLITSMGTSSRFRA